MPVRTDGLGIIDCGDYSDIREYAILNLVTDGGSSYICRKAPCLGKPLPVLPNNRTEYWVLAARKGSDVQMRVTETAVQWCVAGQDWADLIQLSEMTAASTLAVEKAGEAATARDDAILAKEGAESAKRDAESSAESAASNATAAINARATAVSAKNQAELAATGAGEQADIALGAKTAALNAQTAAENAETGAKTAQTAAESARDTAVTAKDDALLAKGAAQSAKTASEAARDLSDAARADAVIARGGAETARDEARASVESIKDLTVQATTLPAGSQATAAVDSSGEALAITLGLPTGATGATGFAPLVSISKTGKVTTVDITDSLGTKTATINDGLDGIGSGNMHTDAYDTNDDGRVDGADEADKLTTPRKISISGGATGTATDFDGSADITIPVTALDVSKATAGTLGIERGGTGATTADGARSNIGAASTNVYTATIPNTGWLGSAAPYSIDVTAVGILSTDAPIVDIVQSGTWATDEVMIEDWGKITRIITDMDKITVYASGVPTATVPIQMKVVR